MSRVPGWAGAVPTQVRSVTVPVDPPSDVPNWHPVAPALWDHETVSGMAACTIAGAGAVNEPLEVAVAFVQALELGGVHGLDR